MDKFLSYAGEEMCSVGKSLRKIELIYTIYRYTPCLEKGATTFLPLTLSNSDRFSKVFFIDRLSNEFLVKRWQNRGPHLKHVVTLPCEIL